MNASQGNCARVPDGPYYHPDTVVVPSSPAMEDAEQDALLNPLVIVEALPPAAKRSTAAKSWTTTAASRRSPTT